MIRAHRLSIAWMLLSVCMLAPEAAYAETNPTPIAIPLTGTSGAASPYPSTVIVDPPGGPTDTSTYFQVTLHAVTHPCLQDLAVLLVHDDTERYLLLSNAGGCRPLQGTELTIDGGAFTLPAVDPSTTPYGSALHTGPSNYAPTPVFREPILPGPYTPGLPPSGTRIQGTWSLFVMDLHDGNRGVMAGGWSLSYDAVVSKPMTSTIAVAIPSFGPAHPYPVTFDLTDIRSDVRVRGLTLSLDLNDQFADDVRMVLQSPSGTTAIVMANAGGGFIDTRLIFTDEAGTFMPDDGPIPAGPEHFYKPSAYETPIASLSPPAPPAPYATAFAAFANEPAAGIWRLWVYDDTPGLEGEINAATLSVGADVAGILPPLVDTPTIATSYVWNEPFITLGGEIANLQLNADRPRFSGTSRLSGTWRTQVDGVYYAAGAFAIEPLGEHARFSGRVPLKKGTNDIYVTVLDSKGSDNTSRFTVTVDEFAYVLSEGATGGFFDEDVTIGNASDAAAPITVNFLQEDAVPVVHTDTVTANAPLQLHVDDLVPPGAVSTVVHSPAGVPLAVERTMSWDSTGYGGSGGSAVNPSETWYFGEGSQGYFDTFLLLANDNDFNVDTDVRFLLEGGGIVDHPVIVQAHKRLTIYTGDIPALVNRSFGMTVTAAAPIVAERAMYFPHNGARTFEGGHEAAGATQLSKKWFLAEGATGPFFECFLLLANPNSVEAHATVTYLLFGGQVVDSAVTVPANGRLTINLEGGIDDRLANTGVSTVVTADQGIIVERSMYWPDISRGWREAHNSIGVTEADLRWGVSDIRVGGAREYQTYILLANPNETAAEVQVRLLRTGAAPVTQTYALEPHSRTNVQAVDLAAGAPGTYSADVQVLNFQPIVVEKAMYWNSGGEIWAAGTGVVATPLPPR